MECSSRARMSRPCSGSNRRKCWRSPRNRTPRPGTDSPIADRHRPLTALALRDKRKCAVDEALREAGGADEAVPAKRGHPSVADACDSEHDELELLVDQGAVRTEDVELDAGYPRDRAYAPKRGDVPRYPS